MSVPQFESYTQMNGGKSTLLNALLFGEEVLPTSPTTMTAKITVLEGRENERISATLYTKEQWPQVLRSAGADPTAAEELAEAREAAREAGHLEKDLVQTPAVVLHRDGLSDLLEFVAVPDDGGTFTPYVSQVTVHADRPWLHQVTVADTPGTNDPNPERDRLTRRWIRRADAVIYVTFAGQAGMDAEDVRFLDEHLLHVPAQRRIIAVNKCDSLNDDEAVWRHLRSIREQDLRMRSLLEDEDQVVLVSSLGGLIQAIEEAGRELSEELNWWRPKLSSGGWLDPVKHNVPRLRDRVEERIINTRGASVISSHRAFIDGLFEGARRTRAVRRQEAETHLELLSADWEERAQEMRRIRETLLKLAADVERARSTTTRTLGKAKTRAVALNTKTLKRIETKLGDDLGRIKRISNLADQAQWRVRSLLDQRQPELTTNLEKVVDAIERTLGTIETDLATSLQSAGLGQRRALDYVLPIDLFGIVRSQATTLQREVTAERLGVVAQKATNFFQRLVSTKEGKSDTIEALVSSLMVELGQILEAVVEATGREVKKHVDSALEQMEKDIRELLEGRMTLLRAFEEEDRQEAEERERLNALLGALERELAEIAELEAVFQREFEKGTS